jgi:hypothetical protein
MFVRVHIKLVLEPDLRRTSAVRMIKIIITASHKQTSIIIVEISLELPLHTVIP